MTNYVRGQSHTFDAEFLAGVNGPAVDLDATPTITITRLSDSVIVLGPQSAGVQHPATGRYTYSYAIPESAQLGDYVFEWDGLFEDDPVSASETVSIIAAASMGTAPCDTWPVQWQCELTGAGVAVSGIAVQAATELLWSLSGQRFGLCTVTVRPCRRGCSEWPWGSGLWPSIVAGSMYPMPMKLGSQWLNLTCGYCTTGCSCAEISEVVLPAPVYDIVEVKVDGVVLDASAYRLDEHRLLVRTDGETWPLCNDLRYSDNVVGTWSVTARYGEDVPALGKMAMGELACEFVKALAGEDDCALPQPIQSLTRQGISLTFADANELLENGRTGLRLTDMFIATFNPAGLRRRSQFYDIDGPGYRIAG